MKKIVTNRTKKTKQIDTEIAKLEAELKEVNARVLQLPENANALANAWTIITGVKAGVLEEVEAHDHFTSPSAVYLLVATHLSKAEKAETDVKKKKPFQQAQTVLAGRTPPAGGPQLGPPNQYQSPMAVMDELIALLRHRSDRCGGATW